MVILNRSKKMRIRWEDFSHISCSQHYQMISCMSRALPLRRCYNRLSVNPTFVSDWFRFWAPWPIKIPVSNNDLQLYIENSVAISFPLCTSCFPSLSCSYPLSPIGDLTYSLLPTYSPHSRLSQICRAHYMRSTT